MSELVTLREARCFGGIQGAYRHESSATGTAMDFSVYRPPAAERGPVPVLYFLSGLTCTAENFTTKAGAQRYAAEHGIALVAPDTSPRGLDLPGEHESYDFGSGAGFYVDATEPRYREHYRMATYVVDELPALIEPRFGLDGARRGIFGHSMGGHGALVLALRHPERYRSVSAFAPIVAPSRVPWGQKAFRGYLGEESPRWAENDATELIAHSAWRRPILIDQGDGDEFLERELKPALFSDACERAGVSLTLRMQPGYDHSYYFIATFVGDHIAYHAAQLA
ncbi:MAG: S-formylglutathione hydrolase [Polyangiaceae bacterium]|nr:S-formylglutathione hydrolase [Polyangiaceae bacterium]